MSAPASGGDPLAEVLAEHAPAYTEAATDPTTTFYCKTCSEAAGDWVTWTPAHVAAAIRAHLLSDAVISQTAAALLDAVGETPWATDHARAALTTATEAGGGR